MECYSALKTVKTALKKKLHNLELSDRFTPTYTAEANVYIRPHSV